MHFLINCIQPHAVMAFCFAILFLFGYAYPGYAAKSGSFLWLLFLIAGVLAAICWIVLVLS